MGIMTVSPGAGPGGMVSLHVANLNVEVWVRSSNSHRGSIPHITGGVVWEEI